MVGIGIVGLGEWARLVHIPNLNRVPHARVAALATRNAERLHSAANLIPGPAPSLYTDYREMFRDPTVDAVVISTPNSTHEALALEALAAGKHVLCEKPLSFSLEGCHRVKQAAARAQKVFQIGLELRYADVAQRIQAELIAGTIGDVKMASCVIWRDWGAPQGWRAGEDSSGGIYLELAVHYLDLMDWLVGSTAATVYSTGGRALGTPITDHLWITTSYGSGVLANVGICVFAPAENLIPVEIIGTRGRISGDIITGKVEIWSRSGDVTDRSPQRPADYHFDGFPGSQESLAAFVQAVQTRQEPLSGIQTATRATALALAAGQSEAAGTPVAVQTTL